MFIIPARAKFTCCANNCLFIIPAHAYWPSRRWTLGGKANTDTSTCHSHSYSSNDSCLMVFVILQIRCAARVLKLWYGCSVPDTSSVADIYTDYSSGVLDNDKPVPEEYLKWARIVRIWHRSVEAVWRDKLSASIKKLVTKRTWQFKQGN